MNFAQPILLYGWDGQFQDLAHYKALNSVFFSLSGRTCREDFNWEDFALHTSSFTYVLATESPAYTPACLADEHVRGLPNEPSNLEGLVSFLASRLNQPVDQFIETSTRGALRLFQIPLSKQAKVPRQPGGEGAADPQSLSLAGSPLRDSQRCWHFCRR
jgi:Tat protein secretion system quality control protein TatD with DNase activity